MTAVIFSYFCSVKRIFAIVILLVMTVHCAGRLGVISYLYQQKNTIAQTIGLISELPIAVCSGDYDFDGGFQFVEATDESSTPPIVFQAKEVNLFLSAVFMPPLPTRVLLPGSYHNAPDGSPLQGMPDSVFHPPAIL